MRCIIVPGNGCSSNIRAANWYGFAQDKLQATGLFSEVILTVMPDPYVAKESIWVPFLLDDLRADEKTLLIGHSSGAEATMRLLENKKLFGAVLVSACWTDLGDANEAASGYYARPWEWQAIKTNVGSFGIIQLHSADDPFIPLDEAQHVAESLGSDFRVFEDRSHFFDPSSIEDCLDEVVERAKRCALLGEN